MAARPPRSAARAPTGFAPSELAPSEFSQAMAAAAPFEPRPHLAVAVSGGADSMALLLLADRWARARRGRVTALTVEHGLRPESGAEARQVARWCRARGIHHRILAWRDRPDGLRSGDVQAAARAARYRLLEDWCRANAVLHLLTGHHLEDQAETFLLRLGRQSGPAGLAAMAAVRETTHLRLLRPLLGVPKARLAAHLDARGQDWIEDPSNRDAAYARVRLRAFLPSLAAEGLGAEALAALAGRLGAVRRGIEDRVAALLAQVATPDPAGFVVVDRAALLSAGPELGTRALARVLMAVSGGTYPPRRARLAALFTAVSGSFRGRTLAGCRLVPMDAGRVLVCREPGAVAPPLLVAAGTFRWDQRFRLRLVGPSPGVTLGALGETGGTAASPAGNQRGSAIPAPARAGLPAFRDANGILAVPHLGYRRSGEPAGTFSVVDVGPDVPEPLGGPRFAAAAGNL